MNSPPVTPDYILQLGRAFRASKALLSAVELGVFSALGKGSRDLETLRADVGISQRGARDFFDSLVALRLLERDAAGCYRNSPAADLYLDCEKPTYVGGELENLNKRGYPHWNFLTTALETGPPQNAANAGSYFSSLYADQATLETFAKGMTGGSLLAASAIAVKFPWSEYRTVIDVGTAQGCLPVQLAGAHPHLTGGGFDLPALRPLFDDYVQKRGLGHRLRFHAGDFLNDPLPSADVLTIGRVLHNWGLATKKTLLNKSYDALPASGSLVIYERLIDDERRTNAPGLLASLNMTIMTAGGFDFTGADCITWMQEAGFRDPRIEPLTSELSMIIGRK